MIERYTRPEMGAIWSERRKLETWLHVELAVVDALAEQGVVPDEDAATIRDRAAFTVDEVKEREKVTDHDVAAFVDVVAESVGDAGRWVHHGLTSSDVLDTGLALQLSQAGLMLVGGAVDYRDALVRRAREQVDTLCVGRTHGVHAEPTTFGVKLAGFAFEADRNVRRLERAAEVVSVGALSGAVGTYAANGPEVEEAVLRRLGLAREDVSTQVVPRDRHAELLEAIALAGAGLERFATEVRHLQRTEVRE
ncbi:MAG TPA: lyase family protein, partial [Thermoleophilaceae bacterium]|nr:lyase family protein [Thermoleophilaceae bacterium]